MGFVSWPEHKDYEKDLEKGLEAGRMRGVRLSLASYLKVRHRDHAGELLAALDAAAVTSLGPGLCNDVFAAEDAAAVRAVLLAATGEQSALSGS